MKPPLSGLAATIVGTLGLVAAAASVAVPAPWGTLVAILGFLAAAIAGLSVAPPKVTEGKPMVQGAALTLATTALGLLTQFYSMVPQGWPQSVALAVGALLAWMTGKALPHLGAPTADVGSSKAEVVSTLERGPQP